MMWASPRVLLRGRCIVIVDLYSSTLKQSVQKVILTLELMMVTVVAARKAGSPCSCKLQCFAKFTAEEKSCLLESFNKLGTKNLQDAYLHGLISPWTVQRHRPRQGNRAARHLSYSYKVVMHVLINLHHFLDVQSYY